MKSIRWKKCNTPSTTGTTTTGTTTITSSSGWIPVLSPLDSLSINTLGTYYFTGIIAARDYIRTQILDNRVTSLADKYATQLVIGDESYYPTIDRDLFVQYNQIINAYVILFLRVQDAVSGNRSDSVRSDGKQSYSIVNNGLTFAKNYLDRYIVRQYLTARNITVYRTKNTTINKPLAILEEKVLAKFDLLLSSETITPEEYNIAVQAYNDFVLHLSIYRSLNKSSIVKNRTLDAIKIFTTIYAKKVLPKIEPTLDPVLLQKQQSYINIATVPQKIGDIYTFSRDLKFGDMNQDVWNLQSILKSYGYFGTLSPTSYFGPSTQAYLIQFSREVLQINNPDGIFDTKIREAIQKIDIK